MRGTQWEQGLGRVEVGRGFDLIKIHHLYEKNQLFLSFLFILCVFCIMYLDSTLLYIP